MVMKNLELNKRRNYATPEKAIKARTVQNKETGCIEWQGGKTLEGYGAITAKGIKQLVHRYVYIQIHGDIPIGLCILHLCDNKACCNINHLFLGTHKTNSEDMVKKGRQSKGEQHPISKVTIKIIKDIQSTKQTQKIIAEKYNISQAQVSRIKNKKTWEHLYE